MSKHLLKAVRLVRETAEPVIGSVGPLHRCPLALRWADVRRIEAVADPSALFNDEDLNEPVTYLALADGVIMYVAGDSAPLVAAWETWQDAAPLHLLNFTGN